MTMRPMCRRRRVVLVIVAFVLATVPFAHAKPALASSITHVQNGTNISTGNPTTLLVTFAGAVGGGDLLVGTFRGIGVVTVSDNINGAWTQITSLSNNYLFYRQNSGAAGAGAMTITLSGAVSANRMVVDEFSGVATAGALDQSSTGTISAGSGFVWPAGTTPAVAAGELVYAGAGSSNNNLTATAQSTNGVGMAISGQITNASDGAAFAEYALSSAAGAQNATLLLSQQAATNGGQATFKPLPSCPLAATGSCVANQVLTVSMNPGTLTVVAPANFTLANVTPATTTAATALGALSYTDTLNDATVWSVTLAATDFGAASIPFTRFTIGVCIAGNITAVNGSVGVPTAGAASQTLAGADGVPGTTFSTPITLASATAAVEGSYSTPAGATGNTITMVVPGTATGVGITSTLQYTITG